MIDLAEHAIFVTLAGSHAHGTARPESDVDLRGVCIAPLVVRASWREQFEQVEGPLDPALYRRIEPRLLAHPTAAASLGSKVESVVYDLAKFFRLCAGSNPNALEVLFADERDWLYATERWRTLHARRHEFLSLAVQQTYLDYALSQLKRIRTHRGWLLSPPAARPTRGAFGLPDQPTLSQDDRQRMEAAIAHTVESWGLGELELSKPTRIALEGKLRAFMAEALHTPDEALDAALSDAGGHALGLSDSLMATLAAERRYRAAVKHYDAYQEWKSRRNPVRAALEARFGYDTKHAMHLVRLMRTGLGLVQTGDLEVRRDDAAELSAIRDGGMSYEDLVEQSEHLRDRINAARAESPLPAVVDRVRLDALWNELVFDTHVTP